MQESLSCTGAFHLHTMFSSEPADSAHKLGPDSALRAACTQMAGAHCRHCTQSAGRALTSCACLQAAAARPVGSAARRLSSSQQHLHPGADALSSRRRLLPAQLQSCDPGCWQSQAPLQRCRDDDAAVSCKGVPSNDCQRLRTSCKHQVSCGRLRCRPIPPRPHVRIWSVTPHRQRKQAARGPAQLRTARAAPAPARQADVRTRRRTSKRGLAPSRVQPARQCKGWPSPRPFWMYTWPGRRQAWSMLASL